MKNRIPIASLLPLLVLAAGCNVDINGDAPKPADVSTAESEFLSYPIGGRCVVKYRPDLCGLDVGVSIDTTDINGTGLTLVGMLLHVDDDWVVVEVDENRSHEYWIPREHVFFIRATRPEKKPEAGAPVAEDATEHAEAADTVADSD